MTVIAWDGETLAADKMATNFGIAMTTTKIHKIRNHLVFASGDLSHTRMLIKWFEDGAIQADYPKALEGDQRGHLSVITPDKIIFRYEGPLPAIIENRHYAIGSGRDFALAFMSLGLTADDAVKRTCELSTECGNGIDILTL